ncbi:MAG: hypothetical protein JO128_21080 [Alphaproteobacteria bacterium]|nr:hypothetical protein [Alphaproteobacteria bacterium]
MNSFLVVMAYSALGLWVLVALARLQAVWDTGERQASELRATITAAGLKLMADTETVKKLDERAARAAESAAAAERDQADRYAALARAAPPPPEIHVTSEYSGFRDDTAWVVTFMRDGKAPPQPWEREPKTSLVWAPTPSAALARARKLAEDHRAYIVAGVSPLSTLRPLRSSSASSAVFFSG